MYYNNKIKIINWILFISIIAIILIGVIAKISAITLRIGLVGLSLQQFLLAYNGYKMKRKIYTVGISIITGIFIIVMVAIKSYL